ncbi:transposase [Allofrancisella guangzhouensis]|uniref:Transposase IS200-like domain-containing protein n=1 Tax=Allofrancisella guangzhouensis TaxID=594679 RepID=A0A0A8E5Z5_9GAMM|nr:transposase [Allofrancisella guangzhouensis]AJC49017.1 hypothetical protein SD28_04895 [Allofrancisella guangzhouensis]MBK2027553.1 transposase [Allofrancisella guangzhouensis]MBK2044454.1 transposase [Allofrancisella guangzhouensis]MBK2046091.1 transposase [Allofrancisella guangzhouensis]
MQTFVKRKSTRIKGYDYSQNGYYFITICTKNRVNYFGNVSNNGQIALNSYGSIVYECWKSIPQHYSKAYLDEFVIMPNHIHGILIINNNVETEQYSVLSKGNSLSMTAQYAVTTNRIGLSQILKSYKEMCTKNIRNNLGDNKFQWQRSFYDHVIRDEKSLLKIREYIQNNPTKWHLDKYNCEKQDGH